MLIYVNDFDGWQSDQDDKDVNVSDHNSGQQAASEYKFLITIHVGKPSGGLKDALSAVGDKVRRLSFSDRHFRKLPHLMELRL